MKTSLLYAARDMRVEEISDKEPGPGQVLVSVTAVGVCGSDLHTYLLGNVGGIAVQEPLTLGHEAAGVILQLGAGVEGLQVGQKVAIDPAHNCGVCERCLAGEPHLCLNMEFMGLFPYHGAMRERMVCAASCCVPVPDNLSDISTALLEPLGVALHGSRLANIQVGEDVAVIGCGGIGLLIIRLARLAGAKRIFASDTHPWRLALASNFGADVVMNAREVDMVEQVNRLTNGRGVDVAIEAAWIEETANACCEMARFGGRVILVGIPAEDEIKLRASVTRRKELFIQASRRMKHTYPTSIALASSGQVDLEKIATHCYTLDQVTEGFETASTYMDGVVRAMILPNPRSS